MLGYRSYTGLEVEVCTIPLISPTNPSYIDSIIDCVDRPVSLRSSHISLQVSCLHLARLVDPWYEPTRVAS